MEGETFLHLWFAQSIGECMTTQYSTAVGLKYGMHHFLLTTQVRILAQNYDADVHVLDANLNQWLGNAKKKLLQYDLKVFLYPTLAIPRDWESRRFYVPMDLSGWHLDYPHKEYYSIRRFDE